MKKIVFVASLMLFLISAAHGSSDVTKDVSPESYPSGLDIDNRPVQPDSHAELFPIIPADQTISEEEHKVYDAILEALHNSDLISISALPDLQTYADSKTDVSKEEASKESSSDTNGNGGSDENDSNGISDPLYIWNTAMYHFNDKFYFWFLKPISQGYSAVVPEAARIGVSNFFYNLSTPVRFVGSLMQFKMKNAADELVRFVTNSTLGIGGFLDVAKVHYELTTTEEDIGQALGRYGMGHGIYIVWPFVGPSSLRDTIGFAGKVLLDPVSYVNPVEAAAGIKLYDDVNETTFKIGDYEAIKESAVDPYVAMRNGYLQKRWHQVRE